MMNINIENVRLEVLRMIPASVANDLACFVFYDNHPKDEKLIDIAICTKNGELREYFQRDLVSSINLDCPSQPTDINIIRNSNSELCYIVSVSVEAELYFISSKDKLQIHKKLTNVEKYDIVDMSCSGQGTLRIIKKDDAVPIFFSNNFESLEDGQIIMNVEESETLPIIIKLQEKFVQTKYTKKCNEDTLREYVNIRQNVTLLSRQNLHPNSKESAFKEQTLSISGGLKIKVFKPQVKVCNKKILIILDVINGYEEQIEDVHMFLHSTTLPSLVYTTKIYSKLNSSPFWRENNSTTLKPGGENAIVAVMDLSEIKQNVTSRIELAGSVSYKTSAKEYLLPFDDVLISSVESMGDQFDVLSNSDADKQITILAIMASTEKTELCLRHIKNQNEPDVSIPKLFCMHLQMEKLDSNVIVYRKSPYHTLSGVMVVFNHYALIDKSISVCVHTRSPSQVLALLHCINDAVPSKIIATTPNYKITAKTDELSQYNEEIPDALDHQYNYNEYERSMLKRTTKILAHLDDSRIKMSESKNPRAMSKGDLDIDLFAGGLEAFKDFKNHIVDEAKRGIDCLLNDRVEFNPECDDMIVD